jgi:hypothetical protein
LENLPDSAFSIYQRFSKETDKGPSYDYTASYKRNFGAKGHDLNVDFFLSKSDDEEATDYWQNFLIPTVTDKEFENSYLLTEMDSVTNRVESPTNATSEILNTSQGTMRKKKALKTEALK